MKHLEKPMGIIIHHSDVPDGKACDWDFIKKYHMSYRYQGNIITKAQYDAYKAEGKKGLEVPWDDIAYHFGVESIEGTVTILTGRAINMAGAHCVGKNDHIGICVVGNYDPSAPDEAHMNALVQLTLALLGQFPHLTPDTIHRHAEYAPKSCPGKSFPWEEYMERVRAGWSK